MIVSRIFSISCSIPIFLSLFQCDTIQSFNNIGFVCALSLSLTKNETVFMFFKELVSKVEVFRFTESWLYLRLPSRCDLWPVKQGLSIDCRHSLPLNQQRLVTARLMMSTYITTREYLV